MAKGTFRHLLPDDPIFSEGPTTFVPWSPKPAGTLHRDPEGEVQPSTAESKPLAPAEHEGESTSGSAESSFAEQIEAALEEMKRRNPGKLMDDLELEREERLLKGNSKK